MELKVKTAGFDRIFKLQAERVSDIKEPLSETGQEIRQDSKETFAEERSRTGAPWDPLAGSTKRRLEQTTAGPVTIKGQVRKKYIRQVESYLSRQHKAGKFNALAAKEFYRLARGGSADDAVHESVRGSFKRLRRELGKSEEKRQAGKRQADKHKLLGRIYSMIRLSVSKTGMRVGILKDSPLAIHNEGGIAGKGAKLPARTFIELLASDVERLGERLVRWIVAEDK